jgi:hypothetical protein
VVLLFGGLGSDLIDRRLTSNLTLFTAAAFRIAAGTPPNFVACAVLVFSIGFGVSGNRMYSSLFMLYLIHCIAVSNRGV